MLVITEEQIQVEPKEMLPAFLAEDEKDRFKELLPKLEVLSEQEQDELIKTEIFGKRPTLSANRCLFCTFEAGDRDQLRKHMYDEHSF